MWTEQLKNLPNDTIVYDVWDVAFIKTDAGLINKTTNELLSWNIIEELYGHDDWENEIVTKEYTNEYM